MQPICKKWKNNLHNLRENYCGFLSFFPSFFSLIFASSHSRITSVLRYETEIWPIMQVYKTHSRRGWFSQVKYFPWTASQSAYCQCEVDPCVGFWGKMQIPETIAMQPFRAIIVPYCLLLCTVRKKAGLHRHEIFWLYPCLWVNFSSLLLSTSSVYPVLSYSCYMLQLCFLISLAES